MSVFDKIVEVAGEIINNSWVKWVHLGVPDGTEEERLLARDTLNAEGHCLVCTSMDGCYFSLKKSPPHPLHAHCDCLLLPTSSKIVKKAVNAFCDIKKFTNYVFNESNAQNNGKFKLFSSWGYDILDSEHLANEISILAQEQYLLGNYTITKLTDYGPLLKIPINLDGRTFSTGWRLLPNGRLNNTTPYADDR